MKKISILAMAALLVALTTACSNSNNPSTSSASEPSSSSSSATPQPAGEPSDDSESASTPKEEKIFVADAAMYRGTITSIQDTEDGKLISLQQAEGTDFGSPTMKVLFTENTRTSFAEEQLEVGAYLEVFYGVAPDAPTDFNSPTEIIGANLYPDAEMMVFNGTIEEILPSEEKEGSGRILMKSLEEDGQEVLFLYDAENSTFYLNFDELKPGDTLNLFHRGTYTLSLPPQGFILEARPYAEAAN